MNANAKKKRRMEEILISGVSYPPLRVSLERKAIYLNNKQSPNKMQYSMEQNKTPGNKTKQRRHNSSLASLVLPKR